MKKLSMRFDLPAPFSALRLRLPKGLTTGLVWTTLLANFLSVPASAAVMSVDSYLDGTTTATDVSLLGRLLNEKTAAESVGLYDHAYYLGSRGRGPEATNLFTDAQHLLILRRIAKTSSNDPRIQSEHYQRLKERYQELAAKNPSQGLPLLLQRALKEANLEKFSRLDDNALNKLIAESSAPGFPADSVLSASLGSIPGQVPEPLVPLYEDLVAENLNANVASGDPEAIASLTDAAGFESPPSQAPATETSRAVGRVSSALPEAKSMTSTATEPSRSASSEPEPSSGPATLIKKKELPDPQKEDSPHDASEPPTTSQPSSEWAEGASRGCSGGSCPLDENSGASPALASTPAPSSAAATPARRDPIEVLAEMQNQMVESGRDDVDEADFGGSAALLRTGASLAGLIAPEPLTAHVLANAASPRSAPSLPSDEAQEEEKCFKELHTRYEVYKASPQNRDHSLIRQFLAESLARSPRQKEMQEKVLKSYSEAKVAEKDIWAVKALYEGVPISMFLTRVLHSKNPACTVINPDKSIAVESLNYCYEFNNADQKSGLIRAIMNETMNVYADQIEKVMASGFLKKPPQGEDSEHISESLRVANGVLASLNSNVERNAINLDKQKNFKSGREGSMLLRDISRCVGPNQLGYNLVLMEQGMRHAAALCGNEEALALEAEGRGDRNAESFYSVFGTERRRHLQARVAKLPSKTSAVEVGVDAIRASLGDHGQIPKHPVEDRGHDWLNRSLQRMFEANDAEQKAPEADKQRLLCARVNSRYSLALSLVSNPQNQFSYDRQKSKAYADRQKAARKSERSAKAPSSSH